MTMSLSLRSGPTFARLGGANAGCIECCPESAGLEWCQKLRFRVSGDTLETAPFIPRGGAA